MKLSYWIYFEKPNEKEQLKEIMENNNEEYQQIQKIMEVFGVDMLTASRVIQIYNEHIKK